MIIISTIFTFIGFGAGTVICFLLAKSKHKSEIANKEALYSEKLDTVLNKNEELLSENNNIKKINAELNQRNNQLFSETSVLKEKLNKIEELSSELKLSKTKLEQTSKANIELEKQVSHLETLLLKERKASQEKLEILTNAQETLKKEFENLSNKIFEEKREKILEQNKDNLSTIITPLREQLKDFKQKVEDVYDKESKQRFSLQQEISSLKELNNKISKDAVNLTNALKGDHKTQGAWGEIILENVLQDSGLKKGREYLTQFSTKDEEGKIKRPDVIVRLPDNKDVIIDSKVTLTAYEKFHSTDDLKIKEQALKEFIFHIKNHISGLSLKNYEDLPEIRTLDYVLMFIPIEGAFMTAIETDKKLFSDAFQKGIVLVSPATLLVVLKTIQSIWRYEYQNRNSKEIADRAGKLYDKFCGFIDSLKNVGKHIERADQEYHNAFKLLSQGQGNLVTQVQKIKKLGLKTKKSIPTELVEISNNFEEEDKKSLISDNLAADL